MPKVSIPNTAMLKTPTLKTRTLKKSSGKYMVVLVTCGSRAEAKRIAREIVSRRLAACANLLETPVQSIYRWKGQVEKAREFLLLIKTSVRRLPALEAEVRRLHSYDVPEFIALPIFAGSPAYLAWLEKCLVRERIRRGGAGTTRSAKRQGQSLSRRR